MQGICERNGKREAAEADGAKNGRGGKRLKGELKEGKTLHADASDAKAARLTKSEGHHGANG